MQLLYMLYNCYITVIYDIYDSRHLLSYNCYQTSDFILIIVKMTIEFERDQYVIENKRKPKVTELGRQRWKMKTLLLQRCASHKFHLINVPNTRDQILSDQRRFRCE